jgi:hypothetical protein
MEIGEKRLGILIVDDDKGDRRQLTRALAQAGVLCECVETETIEAALGACEARDFDCAVVDYALPGNDGLACIPALRQRLPFMPIIMATGKGDEMIAAAAIKLGACDYIPKAQIQPQSIRRVIDGALEKADLQRRIAQQQEELEKFAAVLVHDLKSPITAIRAFARYIESGIRSEPPDRDTLASHCRHIGNSVRRMEALINTLYEYTKADAYVALRPVEMHEVMSDAISNLETTIDERQARVTHGELPVVMGSHAQLTELLQNLIGNSLKYCEAPVPIVEVAATRDGDRAWRFAVKDNGIGIAEKNRRRIFEPFERLHGTGKYEGSGLGLAICKKIVERHGGAIWCEGGGQNGSTFFFTLPETISSHG